MYFLSKKRNFVPDNMRTTNVGKHMPITSESGKRCRLCNTKEAQSFFVKLATFLFALIRVSEDSMKNEDPTSQYTQHPNL